MTHIPAILTYLNFTRKFAMVSSTCFYKSERGFMRHSGLKMLCHTSLCKWFARVLTLTLIGFLAAISGCTLESKSMVEQNKLTQQESRSVITKATRAQFGEASWYGPGFHGKKTASGEIFDQTKMTAAHPELPMGTQVKVTNLENDKKVEVRVNDRGPYVADRVIDVSLAAAKKLDMINNGVVQVKIETKLIKKADSAGQSSKTNSE